MSAGSLAVACLADVPDWPVLGRRHGRGPCCGANAGNQRALPVPPRPPRLDGRTSRRSWRATRAECDRPRSGAKAGEPAIIADVEGLDFLGGKLERLEEVHERGVRHVQLVHYTPNDIGDFQTGAITHQGLTEFGAEVIRACDRLGLVCDVAHATEDMAKQTVKVATKPLLLSHTAVLGSRAMGRRRSRVGRSAPAMRGR